MLCKIISLADPGHEPKAHSIRGLAASLAFLRTHSTEEVQSLGGWRSTTSFSSCEFHTLILTQQVRNVSGQDCPCTWYEVSRAWYCDASTTTIPTDCWTQHTGVSKLVFQGSISYVSEGDLDHENLEYVTSVEMRGVEGMEAQSLSSLTHLVYLDLRNGKLTELPDMSALTHLVALEAEGNLLNSVPDLTHLTHLRDLHLSNNSIDVLPDDLLPASSYALNVDFRVNDFSIINAHSLNTATDGSYLAFDDLTAIRATQDESDVLVAKNLESNIDLLGIIVITDDPTEP
ncbi:hypothetical protein Pmani_021755 [Petrolisthes manimaculis]|uniref:Leucine-rich repeat domain-containing protein n=1 Tax=Petrolisthes manimaculis TaxID=1843537 RepID=A0AAE1U500_9EUCA|nr:hypothetical protein Pmani_021755 [Petrolisthes manimaculis]